MLSCVWQKVCVSAAVNTTNLLTHGTCDALVRDDGMAALVTQLFEEVISVGEAIGATFGFTAAEKIEWCRGRFPACRFSMLQARRLSDCPLAADRPCLRRHPHHRMITEAQQRQPRAE